MDGRPWWRDKRAWVVLIALAGVGLLDVVVRGLPLFAFMLVPLVASALLGRPVFTIVATAAALLLAVALVWVNQYTVTDFASRLILIGVSGIAATALAAAVQRQSRSRRQALALLTKSEDSFRILAEHSVDVVVRADGQGSITYLSPSVTDLLGYEPEELTGVSVRALIAPGEELASELVISGEQETVRTRLQRKDTSMVWVDSASRVIIDADGHPAGLVATWRNVDAEVARLAEAEHDARTDALTGAPNRREALSRLAHFTGRRGPGGSLTAVLFVDVDKFKTVNDTFGHSAGDQLLQELTNRLNGAVRTGDVVARTGGDEFLVLLDDLHSTEEAVHVAEKLIIAARRPIHTDAGAVTISISVGIATIGQGETPEQATTSADNAMYEAKRAGGNQLAVARRPAAP